VKRERKRIAKNDQTYFGWVIKSYQSGCDQQRRENIVPYHDIFYRLGVGRQNDRACGWLWGSELMPNTRKILIVDDDPQLRDALTEQLSLHEEFEAVAAENGSKGVQAAKAGQIDLVIMDVGLPDIDGREAVRILRKNGFKAPIIMLCTAKRSAAMSVTPFFQNEAFDPETVDAMSRAFLAACHTRGASSGNYDRMSSKRANIGSDALE
jgi:CheY-like chemotaxis protein